MNERIKQLRDLLGMSQEEFATSINLKRNSLSLIELGKRNPSSRTIMDICEKHNVNEDWLRNGWTPIFRAKMGKLDAMIEEYELSETDRVFIEKFIGLSKENRATVAAYFVDVAKSLSQLADQSSSEDDLDIDAEVEEYRRQLELQKKAKAESSQSSGQRSTGNENRLA